MALDCQSHKTALHRLGKEAVMRLAAGSTQGQKYRLATNPEDEPVIPSEDVFAFPAKAASSSSSSSTSGAFRMPLAAECAAHLELLETFYVLRQRILRDADIDTAVGIAPVRETKTGYRGDTKTLKDSKLLDRRQEKWTKFIEFAAVRFLAWREALNRRASSSGGPSGSRDDDLEIQPVAAPATITDFYLPPVDVLMVWHAFLLNPRLFQLHCRDEPIYRMRIPWHKVHASIDNRDWTFKHHPDAAARFEEETKLAPDLFEQFRTWPTQLQTQAEKRNLQIGIYKLDGSTRVPSAAEALKPEHQVRRYLDLFQDADQELAVQLRDAVVRQTSFVDKMNAHMWIRSPALAGTVRRGIDRYGKFVELLRLHPTTMLVPTLDVDLAWHTHQCTGWLYARGMKERVGRFVNHDDSIVKDRLEDGYGTTRRLFRLRFGGEYRNCGCWDCEALLSALEDAVTAGAGAPDMAAIAKRVDDEVTYYRTVEVSRRKKRPLPLRT